MTPKTRHVAVAALVGALALAGAFVVMAERALRPVALSAPAQVIIIPPGSSLSEIADRLERAGLIRSRLVFVVTVRLRGVGGRMQSGEYRLAPSMSTPDILEKIVRGEVLLHRVTIPEGFSAGQIADALARAGLADREAFLRVVRHEGDTIGAAFLAGQRDLEGYLFPDTYHFPRGLSAREIAAALLVRFAERVTPALRAEAAARGLSLHEVVTVASMIEREARLAGERPLIAGVIYNRLRRGWRLEIDATVLYALGRRGGRLSTADLQVESPYNTYRVSGLPPGPICNPGLAAIEAALRPAQTPYLFYVLRPDGSHAFSMTFEDHQRAIRRWRP